MRAHVENETQIDADQPTMPETVSAALAETAGAMREGTTAPTRSPLSGASRPCASPTSVCIYQTLGIPLDDITVIH